MPVETVGFTPHRHSKPANEVLMTQLFPVNSRDVNQERGLPQRTEERLHRFTGRQLGFKTGLEDKFRLTGMLPLGEESYFELPSAFDIEGTDSGSFEDIGVEPQITPDGRRFYSVGPDTLKPLPALDTLNSLLPKIVTPPSFLGHFNR